VAALGTQSFGQLGNSAFGAGIAVAWRSGGARVELDGALIPHSHVDGVTAGANGNFDLWFAGFAGCWSPFLGRVGLGGCAGAEAGRIDAEANGRRVSTADSTQSAWMALKGGALLVWNVTPVFALRIGADAVAPVVRNRFFVANVGDVYTPSPVTARWHGGVEVQFR
jgi:hypothetical protein